jgi:chromosome partitioning protein
MEGAAFSDKSGLAVGSDDHATTRKPSPIGVNDPHVVYYTHTVNEIHRDVAGGDLVGIAEIAAMARVGPTAVVNWRARGQGFPEPVAELRAGPVFSRVAVRRWLRRQRKGKGRMSTVLSTINLKGGVGKTTTTVGIAEMLVAEHGMRVLVIDLDPQTNATVSLIDEQVWKNLDEQGLTVAQLFIDALSEDPAARRFRLDDAIQADVGSVPGLRGLDLLPSSLRLIDVQEKLAAMPLGQFYSMAPSQVLETAIKRRLDDWDYILVDCPPNLGIITLNGLRISDGFVIPTIPDTLSTYGIPQILSRAEAFAENIDEPIEPIGIIISKYREQSPLHQETVKRLRSNKRVHVFKTKIPERNATAAAAEHASQQTFRQRYGYDGNYDTFQSITRELRELVGDREQATV